MTPLPRREHQPPIVHEYGCCECQAYHVREIEPELYEAHLMWQSKHGCRERQATIGEIFQIEMKEN